MEQSFLKMKTY